MAEQTRERSTVRFPYGALSDAEAVAEAVWKHGLSCTIDQLAAQMGQNLSGAFRNKVATASTFGVVETSRGQVTLTDLGERMVDPQTVESARVEAFMMVPLYELVYDAFRGRRLPGEQGLEAEFVKFGVSPKQASKARQAMMRSADQAGFFLHGRDRLVEPPLATSSVGPVAADAPTPAVTSQVHQQPDLPHHPLIVGLWGLLPDPQSGKPFTAEQQAEWLDAAKVNLRVLYGSHGNASSFEVEDGPDEPDSFAGHDDD
jgi:hypothetical protein